MEKKYKNNYDNPYRMLAAGLVSHLTLANIHRILSDKDYIRQLIQAEVRDNIDVPGMFSDCITAELISESQKVLYRDALNELGLFFYRQLDISRLRSEIQKFCEEFDIKL